MDTLRNVKITIEGASLTQEDRDRIMRAIEDEMMNVKKEKTEEVKEEKETFKDKFDNFKWNLGVKWNMLSPQNKVIVVTGLATTAKIVTGTVINVVNEARLIQKERRLQRKERERRMI